MSDSISRADAIEAVCRKCSAETRMDCALGKCFCCDRRELEALPSADDEFADLPDIPRAYYEKVIGKMAHEINMLKEQLESADVVQGEWVKDYEKNIYKCSVCGCEEVVPTCMGEPTVWKYCPNCGSAISTRMKGGAE